MNILANILHTDVLPFLAAHHRLVIAISIDIGIVAATQAGHCPRISQGSFRGAIIEPVLQG